MRVSWWNGLKRWWPSRAPATQVSAPRNEVVQLGDPRLAEWFGAQPSWAGVEVTERAAMGLSAFYRGALLVAGSLAGLPLNTLRDSDGVTGKVTSMFDDPGGAIGLTPFVWKEMQIFHLLMHGDAFLFKIFNGAGALAALRPVHPLLVKVEWNDSVEGGKTFTLPAEDGCSTTTVDASKVAQIMGPTTDGLRGMSLIALARTSLGGAIAGDRTAARTFGNGALISGLVSPQGEPVDDDDEKKIDDYIADKVGGWENAGAVRFVNRPLTFTPWTMSLEDAQFLQSRQFSIQEVARWLGVPSSLLNDPGAVSTWGTGVEIQQRGLSRFTLTGWAKRMEEVYTSLIAGSRFVKFDFHELERGAPADEVALINAKIDGGLMTINEGRRALGLPGIGPDGDVLRLHGQPVGALPAADASAPTSSPPAPQTRVPAPPASVVRKLVEA